MPAFLTQGSMLQNTTLRQASMGLPPTMGSGSGGLGLAPGPSQTLRQASVGSARRQPSLGLPQGQGSLGLVSGGSLNAAQRQSSLGLPPSMGSGGMPFEPSPQELQVIHAACLQGVAIPLQCHYHVCLHIRAGFALYIRYLE